MSYPHTTHTHGLYAVQRPIHSLSLITTETHQCTSPLTHFAVGRAEQRIVLTVATKRANQQVFGSESVDELHDNTAQHRPYKPLWPPRQDEVSSGSLLGLRWWWRRLNDVLSRADAAVQRRIPTPNSNRHYTRSSCRVFEVQSGPVMDVMGGRSMRWGSLYF